MHCVVRSLLPVCRRFSLAFSSPVLFPTTCGVSDKVYSPRKRGGQHLVTPPPPPPPPSPLPHTRTCHVASPQLPCCTSGSCESQCCSLIQGKCQTQERLFKYLHVQRFFVSWNGTLFFFLSSQHIQLPFKCKGPFAQLMLWQQMSAAHWRPTRRLEVHITSNTVALCVCILTLSLFA